MIRIIANVSLLALATAVPAVAQATAGNGQAFRPTDHPGEFAVDTGALKGIIRQGGKSVGLVPFESVDAGTPLAKPPGLFNYYRLFTTDHRHGESARGRASQATLLPDGGLRVHWPVTPECPFELTGVYRWRTPTTLDLETTVVAQEDLPDFEVFLAAYCSDRFPATSAYVNRNGKPGFMTGEKEHGTWMVFPRDDDAKRIVADGRWTIPPSPVDWVTMPTLAAPLAYRRDPNSDITLAIMAPPRDCFAVFTPCRDEGHRSMYLSLFGRTLKKGQTAVAHARLVVGQGMSDSDLTAAYEAFIHEHGEEKP